MLDYRLSKVVKFGLWVWLSSEYAILNALKQLREYDDGKRKSE